MAPYGESATISFPYSVPLDGTIFLGPAQFTANIDGFQKTVILPSENGYFYGPPTEPTGPNINALQVPYPEGLGTVTVAGTPPPVALQPDPGLNSADFVFATVGETHFFEVYGTYANGAGFDVNDVVFTLSPQQPVQTPLQITTTSLPNAVSHQIYTTGLAASGEAAWATHGRLHRERYRTVLPSAPQAFSARPALRRLWLSPIPSR